MLRQAIILCGGLGSRLGELTARTPKPLLPVGRRPFLDVLIHELGRHGFEEVLLLASFEADQVRAYADNHPVARRFGMTLRVLEEPERAGTGGALYFAAPEADREFLLLNGDSWLDLNLRALPLGVHPNSRICLSLRRVPDASRYGVVELEDGIVRRFLERPSKEGPNLVNGGVYWVRNSIFDALQPNCSLEREVLPLLADRSEVQGRVFDGYFIDIGIPEHYERAQSEVPEHLMRSGAFIDERILLGRCGRSGAWSAGAVELVKALNDSGRFVFIIGEPQGSAAWADPLQRRELLAGLYSHGAHLDDYATGEKGRRDTAARWSLRPSQVLEIALNDQAAEARASNVLRVRDAEEALRQSYSVLEGSSAN